MNRRLDQQFVHKHGQLLRVVLWMTGALLSFSAMAVSVRVLSETLSVIEILTVRSGLGLLVMTALTTMRHNLRATILTRQLPLHLLRNTLHLGAQYLWATSLLLLPLATVFALEFTAPAWTLVLALRSSFLRHKAIARWTYPIWLYVSVTGVMIYFMVYKWFV